MFRGGLIGDIKPYQIFEEMTKNIDIRPKE